MKSVKLIVSVFFFSLLVCTGTTFASRGTYRFEMALSYDGQGRLPFVHEIIMDRRQKQDFEFNKRKFLKKELLEAQKALAIKKGYIPQVYGNDYYKLVRILSWTYKVIDLQTDKVVIQGKGK